MAARSSDQDNSDREYRRIGWSGLALTVAGIVTLLLAFLSLVPD
jgi:hypothetical protein